MDMALLTSAPMLSSPQIVNLQPLQSEDSLAALLKAAGDELRLQILRVMAQDSYGVSELCDIFEMRQSALSHHLKILIDAGFLNRKKEGTATFYRRALPDGPRAALHQEILLRVDETKPSRDLIEGVARVHQQRECNSLAFFKGNLDRFRQQQELIAPWEDYSEVTLQLLDRNRGHRLTQIIEIGIGEGWLLPALHERAAGVVALDLSEAMLMQARAFAGHLPNIEFVQGSTAQAITAPHKADAVIANMVLHHTPNPKQILCETSQLLNTNGRLIVSELCAHDQAWAREHCGDLWLGFAPEQLHGWAEAAGLSASASVFIAQRNGFQIQIHQFEKTPSALEDNL
jgi:2-polyprenyl-3-methyl-5-hydroxy-6-metoxy-1,4-benzoquinol methylase